MISREEDKIVFLPLDQLEFDIDNPRLPNSIGRTKKDILSWMLKKENVTDLMLSIGEKGFFPGEPILVVPNPNTKDKFIVIEGNRRFTAASLLANPDLAPIKKTTVKEIFDEAEEHPMSLPTLIFSAREDILDYLGYRHITGVESWDALAKARYLRQLSERLGNMPFQNKCKILAKQIGSKAPYVKQLLLGVDLYELIESKDFFGVESLDDTTFDFGTFYTGIIKPNISKHINLDIQKENPTEGINIDSLGEITKWFFEKNEEGQTRLGESRNLKHIDKILDPKYSQALQYFREGNSLSISVSLTDEPDNIALNSIKEAEEKLNIVWRNFPQVKDYSKFKIDDLKRISKIVKEIHDFLVNKQVDNSGNDFLV